MPKALSFALWLIVLGLGWSQLRPLVGKWIAPSSGSTPPEMCIQAATKAYDVAQASIYRLARPPADKARWGGFRLEMDDLIETGRSHCSCEGESCSKGSLALDALEGTLAAFDTAVSRGSTVENGSRMMESVRTLLNTAIEWR